MLLTDHINLQCRNPLIGPNDPIGTRFPSLMNAYDSELRTVLKNCAHETAVVLHEGVYLACLGPSFETPAEIRAFKVDSCLCVCVSVSVCLCVCVAVCSSQPPTPRPSAS